MATMEGVRGTMAGLVTPLANIRIATFLPWDRAAAAAAGGRGEICTVFAQNRVSHSASASHSHVC